jgi:hypothetical protein
VGINIHEDPAGVEDREIEGQALNRFSGAGEGETVQFSVTLTFAAIRRYLEMLGQCSTQLGTGAALHEVNKAQQDMDRIHAAFRESVASR